MASRQLGIFILVISFGMSSTAVALAEYADYKSRHKSIVKTTANESIPFKKNDLVYLDGESLWSKMGGSRGGVNKPKIVDLRNEAEFRKQFIPNSMNIPYSKLSNMAEKLFSKSDDIVFVHSSGMDHISENAVVFMRNKGFTRSQILEGGLGAWPGDFEVAPGILA